MTEKNNEKAETTLSSSSESRVETKAQEATSSNTPKSAPKKTTQRTVAAPRNTNKGTGLAWFFALVNLGLIGAAGFAGYQGWQYWQQYQADQSRQITQLQKAQNQLQTELISQLNSVQQQNIDAIKEQFAGIQGKLGAQDQRIAEIFEQTQRLSGSKSSHWQVSEAAFLLRMAGRKLWFEKDAATSIQLLKLADQQLANITDSRLYPIRQKLSQDIAQLQALNYAAPTKTAIQIQALYQQIPQLSFIQPGKLQTQGATDKSLKDEGAWARTKRWLKDNIFDVTRHDKPISPFISEQQQWLVAEQVKYQLLIAQSALLRNQQTIYLNALKEVENAFNRFFVMDSAQGKATLEQLTQLQSHEFESAYPEQLSSELALNDFIKQTALENAL
ncbi:uroporphyrinogen-III C-methyltransferase [Alteromonas sp. a30]|uniref:uroporphyrinogen-III C-methyltransferase n=1 Tax=Alteromonas sp. a30 TaxID=2730917 RepID=UPI002282F48F|nr:uroporphyrinogen-III C-methyltransferase [Alteromonas sp. a30]MCY7296258.1 hypothetical protein [Alteromonas sp. a30]